LQTSSRILSGQFTFARRSINLSSEDADPIPLVSDGFRPDITTTRKEAIYLYRDILRAARHFTWRDKDGKLWRDKLIASARHEFELARGERDPEILARLLVGGREALEQVADRMLHKARKIAEEERNPLKQRNASNPLSSAIPYAEQDAKSWQKTWEQKHLAWEHKTREN
jgi:hypothetical protein